MLLGVGLRGGPLASSFGVMGAWFIRLARRRRGERCRVRRGGWIDALFFFGFRFYSLSSRDGFRLVSGGRIDFILLFSCCPLGHVLSALSDSCFLDIVIQSSAD